MGLREMNARVPLDLEGSEGIKVSLEIKCQAEDATSKVGMPPKMEPESVEGLRSFACSRVPSEVAYQAEDDQSGKAVPHSAPGSEPGQTCPVWPGFEAPNGELGAVPAHRMDPTV
jgi:hypothetical protein